MEREELAVVLEAHGTDAAGQAAVALRAGARFWVSTESMQSASHYHGIWSWRAGLPAVDGGRAFKDFEQGLPALRLAGEASVALGRVDTPEGVRVLFLAADLSACVAVL